MIKTRICLYKWNYHVSSFEKLADAQFIELCEVGGDRTFPIVVGKAEAYAIDRRLKGIDPPTTPNP